MSDNLLSKYIHREREPANSPVPPPDDDEEEDCGAFGFLRGMRERAHCLELRRKTGDVLAIAYACIETVEYDPSHGITIHALGAEYRIEGRNLNQKDSPRRLFEGIARGRVPWVQESGGSIAFASLAGAAVVERVSW